MVEYIAENDGVVSSILTLGTCGCRITIIIAPCQGADGGLTPLTRFFKCPGVGIGRVVEWDTRKT